jgi:hypothetical protein
VTSPKLAIATNNGRYYTDPNPAFDGALYPSVTNVLSNIAKPALVPAAAKEVAEYAMATLPALVKASRNSEDAEAALKELKSRARVVWDAAAQRGTWVHDLAEAHLLGLPKPEIPAVSAEEVEAYFQQYLQFIDDFGIDFEADMVASEASVVNRTVGYAGTMDVLFMLLTQLDPEPVLWLIDVKTSAKHPVTQLWQEYPYQLAALRHAEKLWIPNGTEEPMPFAARCGILNLRPKGYALMAVEAGVQEFATFKSALALTRGLHSQKLPKNQVLPVRSEKAVA